MIISFKDRSLSGTIEAPASKSIYHRELIVRFLCGDRSNLMDLPGDNDDVKATKACLRALKDARDGVSEGDVILPCNESGSTLRFMIPVASAFLLRAGNSVNRRLVFETKGRLCDRPLGELSDAMAPHGISISKDMEARTVIVEGEMTSGIYTIDGSVSSQYISGLIMALPMFDEESRIDVTGGIKSVHYIELTENVLKKYGCGIRRIEDTYYPENNGYKTKPNDSFSVEGDWSNGAFLLCLKEFTGIEVTNLNPDSAQGDKAIVDFLSEVKKANGNEVTFDCADIPDIAPYMAVLAAFKTAKTTLTSTARLRIKESDRSKAVCEQLAAVGVKTEENEDSIVIYGFEGDAPEDVVEIDSYHDHRMAMCAVLIAAALKTEISIDEIDCMNKSFPELRELVIKELCK